MSDEDYEGDEVDEDAERDGVRDFEELDEPDSDFRPPLYGPIVLGVGGRELSVVAECDCHGRPPRYGAVPKGGWADCPPPNTHEYLMDDSSVISLLSSDLSAPTVQVNREFPRTCTFRSYFVVMSIF